MKYRSITISGPIASGTTTAAKGVAEKLGLEYHSAGDFFRQYALEHNIPLWAKEEIPDDVDRAIDKEMTDLAASDKQVMIDSLYAGYFTRKISHVLKVLLTCDENVRIKRALERVSTHQETAADVRKRDAAHDIKFRKLYANENFLDPKFFDMVIDTTDTTVEETADKIVQKFKGEN